MGGHGAVAKICSPQLQKAVNKELFKLYYKNAIDVRPENEKKRFIEHFADWPVDNVAKPGQVIDEKFIKEKYFLSTFDRPKNAAWFTDLVSFPLKYEDYRNQKLIEHNEFQRQMFYWQTQDKFAFEEYDEDVTNSKYLFFYAVVGFVLFLPLPFVFNGKNWIYDKYLKDTILGPKKKEAWENMVKDENGEWVLKK
ncbi:REEP6 [Acrasis kona]|uniref:REEP6 n=1 Tax=Acrasis kona TaxID=1008807 RepID=A0AAW2ZMC1_9EUKA